MKVETGPVTGAFFYTRDHLGSIREVMDSSGTMRARYAYDPYGRRTKQTGDVEADFGFAGMFWSSEVGLSLTHYRAYDPELGRWLSRDPLKHAEMNEGPNLYAYVVNDPVNHIDPEGLCTGSTMCSCFGVNAPACIEAGITSAGGGAGFAATAPQIAQRATPFVNAAVCQVSTLPGYASAAPVYAQTISSIAPQVSRLPAVVNAIGNMTPAREWFWATWNATAYWRMGLPLEQQTAFFRSAMESTRVIFGVNWFL